MAKGVRTDLLRRRPENVRYHYLAVSEEHLHTGLSYGGLKYANDKYNVVKVYVSDLVTLQVIEVKEPIDEFMNRWRMHYNDPKWNYAEEIASGEDAPVF